MRHMQCDEGLQLVGDRFDLEHYIGLYEGHARIQRLLFLYDHVPEQRPELCRWTLAELRKTDNTPLYATTLQRFRGDGYDPVEDGDWVANTDRAWEDTTRRLDVELMNSRVSLIKESTRLAYVAQGDHRVSRGDDKTALQFYWKAADFCTVSQSTLEVYVKGIQAAIRARQWALACKYAARVQSIPDLRPEIRGLIGITEMLRNLDASDYLTAGGWAVDTPPELGDAFNTVVSPYDVATIGTLCSLATLDRSALNTRLLKASPFRTYWETCPTLEVLVRDFVRCRYTEFFERLDSLRDVELRLDINIHPHLPALYSMIRTRAVRQYVTPFLTVDLTRMAIAFKTPLPAFEGELAALVGEGRIDGRIDSQRKVLHAQLNDARTIVYSTALAEGRQLMQRSEAALLHCSMLRNGVVVEAPRRSPPHSPVPGDPAGPSDTAEHRVAKRPRRK